MQTASTWPRESRASCSVSSLSESLISREARLAFTDESVEAFTEVLRIETGERFVPLFGRDVRARSETLDELLVPARDQRRTGGDALGGRERPALDLVSGTTRFARAPRRRCCRVSS